MLSNALVVIVIVLATFIIVGAGIAIGYHFKEFTSELRAVRAKLASQDDNGGMPEIAIVDAKSPKQIKEELFDEPDEDSAIVIAKKPSELQRERDRKFDQEMEKYR
jgi:hypothetical protein